MSFYLAERRKAFKRVRSTRFPLSSPFCCFFLLSLLSSFVIYTIISGKLGNSMENSGGGVKVVRLSRREKERRILEMWESGHSYKEICSALRVSPKMVAKVLRKVEEGEEVEDIERLIEERVNGAFE